MKTTLRIALGALVCMALFVVAPAQDQKPNGEIKTGPEIANRVKQLQRYNKDVRNALAAFEKNTNPNGHRPKIEDSWSFTYSGKANAQARTKGTSQFRKASFKPPQDYLTYNVEMIFTPTYSVPGE